MSSKILLLSNNRLTLPALLLLNRDETKLSPALRKKRVKVIEWQRQSTLSWIASKNIGTADDSTKVARKEADSARRETRRESGFVTGQTKPRSNPQIPQRGRC